MRLARKSETRNVEAVVMLLKRPKKPATLASSENEAVTTWLNGNATAKNNTENNMDDHAMSRINGEARTKSNPARRSFQRFDFPLKVFVFRKYALVIVRVR